ncbi:MULTISPECIES: exonuclease subunit SbcD [Pseudomonadati]|uniref:Nuclease SbcCD subunit D n=1 Tax=Shewanella aestuarii TaxID=1028752 RepID=A0ABT0KY62_9GAMM|nr:exonuclease subunit SbcD [Shewanella aestuarii]MCL1116388.1 exonuclease subunit SbcD [Shewanella aestuarii]GGN82264.1 nuclease SbcCD subunit D [Shewanella aestuarii]
MRIIHTSDWHLGQHFFGKSRAAEHQAFMAWLLEQIEHYQVDALIIAGDIFDTGTPPSYARTLYNQFIVQMQQSGCQLIILGGNHDSVSMLGESKELLACLNTLVIPGALSTPADHAFEITNRQGEPGAIVCGLPFLRPRELTQSQVGESAKDKQAKLGNAIAEYYQASFEQATQLKLQHQALTGKTLPIIATGHLTTVGASTSESVRDIYIGSLDAFNANLFPSADYIALGHIHRSQKVAKTEHIRYSGSPIALSFDELSRDNQADKSVVLVQWEQDKQMQVNTLDIPMFQPMQMLKGNLTQIAAQVAQFADYSESSPSASFGNTWLSIEVTEQDYLSDLQSRIIELTQHKAIEVLQLKRARAKRKSLMQSQKNETLSELSVKEVFQRRIMQEQFDDEVFKQRIMTKFDQLQQAVELAQQAEHK